MRNGDDEAGRILVVDDDEEIRRLSKLVLESAGYQCAVAPNTRQAQARLSEDDFDLLISDLRMPGESGLRLMENARAAQVDVPTIILTALDDRKAATTAIEQGAYGYITKPFRINELLIGVENALRRRSLEIESRRQRQALEEQLGELEEAARELRRSEEHFRAVAESAVDGIVSTDSDGQRHPLQPGRPAHVRIQAGRDPGQALHLSARGTLPLRIRRRLCGSFFADRQRAS